MFFKKLELSDAPLMAAAIVGACRVNGWANDLQPRFLGVLFKELLNYDADFLTLPPATPEDAINGMPARSMLSYPPLCPVHHLYKREELIDLMVMTEMLCNPVPLELSQSIEHWADKLGIKNQRLVVARDIAKGATARAEADYWRNVLGEPDMKSPEFPDMLRRYGTRAYGLTEEENLVEAARWEALQNCPQGSFGRTLWEFYKKRGFLFPGTIGSVNTALAHHDWIHVLSDTDSNGLGEIEVFAFAAASSASPAATMAFLGQLSIFQSGFLIHVIKGVQYEGHDLDTPDGPKRVADAIRRGKACTKDLVIGLDPFAYANESLEALRVQWNILPRSTDNPRPDSKWDTAPIPQ
jgi:hypothetical protein